jgi:hypothetical protein
MNTSYKLQVTSYKLQVVLSAFCFLLSAFCFLPGSLFAQKQSYGHHTKLFETKNFKVSAKDLLEVNTHYTGVTFQAWDKNEIDFTTTVTMEYGTEKDMEKLLNSINISTNQTGKKVNYKLTLNSPGNKNYSFTIALLVKIPQDIFLKITSSFGDVDIENLRNDLKADISYGNINIENLYGNNNTIKLQYGNLKLGQTNNLALDIQFSEGQVKEALGTFQLNSRFNTIKIDRADFIDLLSAHDNISIRKNIGKIEGKMEFGKLKIKNLNSSCIFKKFSFSDINIDEVSNSFTNITILSNYSNLMLNVSKEQSFAFDYSGSFTTFKEQNVKLNDAIFEAGSNTIAMSGYYGKNADSRKKIKIEASYGTVSLFEQK